MNYKILGDEGTEVNINGVGYTAGTVVDLDENEESVKIALSDGQIETIDEAPAEAPADESAEEESEEEEVEGDEDEEEDEVE